MDKEVMAAAIRALMVPGHEMVDSVARAILAERKRCIGHVYGLAGSDNVAQRTVEAIESGQ